MRNKMKIKIFNLNIISDDKIRNISQKSMTWADIAAQLEKMGKASREFEQSLSTEQNKLKKATALLDEAREKYLDLYQSRARLLQQLAKELIKCEEQGYSQITRELEDILLDDGVERYSPNIGEAPGKNAVKGKLETNMIPEGSVAFVRMAGFATEKGENIILPAEVYLGIKPKTIEKSVIIRVNTEYAENQELQDLADILRLQITG